MTKYFIAVNFNDLKKVFKAIENPRKTVAIYRALVENDTDCIEMFERIIKVHGKVFIDAIIGSYATYIDLKYDEVILLERYKL